MEKSTQNEGKTFTQEEVNRIVGERLGKEKSKLESDLAEREKELARRELRVKAQEMLNEKGLPATLVDALNYSNEETLTQSISTVTEIFDKQQKIKNPPPPVSGESVIADSEDKLIRNAMGL